MRPRPGHFFAILLAAGAGLSSPATAATPFVVESVGDPGNQGLYSSLVLDTQDNPHVSYRDGTTGYLMYATKGGFRAGEWEFVTVDSASSFTFTSLVLDSAGRPHISYYDDVNLELKYVFLHQNGTWNVETVDSPGDVGQYSSLVLDSQDNPHIAYYDDVPNEDLKYATKSGGIWTLETVAATGVVGKGCSIALNAQDLPSISYSDETNTDLRLAQKFFSGGAWGSFAIDVANIATYTSLVIDGQGRHHISYHTVSPSELKYATRSVDLTWTIETVHSPAVEAGTRNSLALDSKGSPHISYSGASAVLYASKVGGTWTLETADDAGTLAVTATSLALDSQDNPHISYGDFFGILRYTNSAVHIVSPVGGDLWVAGSGAIVEWRGSGVVDIQLSEDGGLTYTTLLSSIGANVVPLTAPSLSTATARIRIKRDSPFSTSDSPGNFSIQPSDLVAGLFVSELVDTTGALVGQLSSMDLDEFDNPHICYQHKDGDIKYAVRSVTGAWTVEAVGITGRVRSLKLDGHGDAHVSLWDDTNNDLLYAHRSGAGVWTIVTVDSVGDVGILSSLALDSGGNPHIAYFDESNIDLKYASKSGGIWTIETVDSVGDVGGYPSLALNPQGRAYISYKDLTTGALLLVRRSFGTWSFPEVVDENVNVCSISLALDNAERPHICYGEGFSEGNLKYATRTGAGAWTFEFVKTTDVFTSGLPSLNLDSIGNPHVAFRDGLEGAQYATRSPSGVWTRQSIIGILFEGWSPTLALDSQDQPRIAYQESTHGELMYASAAVHLVSPLGGERWASGSQQTVEWSGRGAVSVELSTDGGFSYSTVLSSITSNTATLTVPDVTTGEARIRINRESPSSTSDSPGSFAIAPGLVSPWWSTTPDATPSGGWSPSLALDNLGNSHIAHSDLNGLLYVERQGGIWVTAVADATPNSGVFASLAFDANGEPHVSHSDFITGTLRYSTRVAGVWMSEEVDPGPLSGFATSLALGAAGDPYISYYDANNLFLKVAHKNGGWSIVTADNSGTVGLATSLALDSRERPHVAYYDQNNLLKLAVSDGAGTYSIETVDEVGDPGEYCSLALDAEDVPHVAYYEANAGDLRYGVKRSGTWHVEPVDTEGDVGIDVSLTLDETGNPIIAYHDVTNGRLKVARRIAGLWWKEFVGEPLSGQQTSVAVDHHGNIRVAYQDYDNVLLQYASAAVELSNPSPSDTWPVGASRTVRWDGTGRVNVSLSVDGGNSFQMLAEGVSGGSHGLVVPHQPSAFSQIMVERAVPHSHSTTPGLFKIETDILLLSLSASAPSFELGTGALITWETDPGPEDLAGYKLDKRAGDGAWSTLVLLVTETSYHDRTATPGAEYRLFGVNGLGEELLLGETTFGTLKPLFAGPLPYRGGDLRITFATFGGLGGGDGSAEVELFDLRGRLVRTIASGAYQAGVQTVTWDGRDEAGREVGSGVYFLRSVTAGESNRLKVVVVR